MGQRGERRGALERSAGPAIPRSSDFLDTAKEALNSVATEIDVRTVPPYDGVVDTEFGVEAGRTRSPRHLVRCPGPSDWPHAPVGRTKGTA